MKTVKTVATILGIIGVGILFIAGYSLCKHIGPATPNESLGFISAFGMIAVAVSLVFFTQKDKDLISKIFMWGEGICGVILLVCSCVLLFQ
jgi:hypothetical protein